MSYHAIGMIYLKSVCESDSRSENKMLSCKEFLFIRTDKYLMSEQLVFMAQIFKQRCQSGGLFISHHVSNAGLLQILALNMYNPC